MFESLHMYGRDDGASLYATAMHSDSGYLVTDSKVRQKPHPFCHAETTQADPPPLPLDRSVGSVGSIFWSWRCNSEEISCWTRATQLWYLAEHEINLDRKSVV